MENGFIMLSRKFFSHRIWRASRTFSDCEAWLDLIQSARFEATRLTASIGGRNITFGRGQYPASIKYLSEKWGWNSEKKVRNFLNELKKEGMITTDCSQGMNIITLCNYDLYNTPQKAEEGEPKGKANYVTDSELNDALGRLRGEVLEAISNLGRDWGKNNKKDNNNKDSSNIPPTPLKGESADLCFVREDFLEVFKSWIDYKREIKNSYRSRKSLELCYNKLLRMSGGDPERAGRIVEQSISNGWKGLFELKQENNGRTDKQTNGAPAGDMEAFFRNIAEGIARADYEERERRE